jgi:hypothetical protein
MGLTKKTRTVEVSPPPTPMKFLLKATLPPPKNSIFSENFDFVQKIFETSRDFHKSAVKFSKFF